jgi:hypothetical protein
LVRVININGSQSRLSSVQTELGPQLDIWKNGDRLRDARVCDDLEIEHFNCCFHLTKCLSKKLLKIRQSVPQTMVLLMKPLHNKMIAGIQAAIKYNRENGKDEQGLKHDLVNSIDHVTGNHLKCRTYFCTSEDRAKPNETETYRRLAATMKREETITMLTSMEKYCKSWIAGTTTSTCESNFQMQHRQTRRPFGQRKF